MTQLNTSFKGPDASPGFLLWRITCQWQSAQRAALAPLDLTHSQFVLLASIVWLSAKSVPTQRELSDFSKIDVMTTSQVTRTLLAKELITRKPSSSDKRSYLLAPTPTGISLARKAIPIVESVDKNFFAPVNHDLPQMIISMQALLNNQAM